MQPMRHDPSLLATKIRKQETAMDPRYPSTTNSLEELSPKQPMPWCNLSLQPCFPLFDLTQSME